jgi:hypothetical protein
VPGVRFQVPGVRFQVSAKSKWRVCKNESLSAEFCFLLFCSSLVTGLQTSHPTFAGTRHLAPDTWHLLFQRCLSSSLLMVSLDAAPAIASWI